MTCRLSEIIVDSREPQILARWWADVLAYRLEDPAPQGWVGISPWPESDAPDEGAYRGGPQLTRIVFVPVGEAKSTKNRVHLDVWAFDRSQEEEVAWLISHGARKVDVGQVDVPWEVMADPEDNEFCVLG